MTAASRLDRETEAVYLSRVRPPGWKNPTPKARYDLVILGSGPAGLAAAATAVGMGASVALVERDRLGGNSLNSGSVPSKAVIHAESLSQARRDIDEFGEPGPLGPAPKFTSAMARMRRVRTRIAEYNSIDRLVAAGIDVFFGGGRFSSASSLTVGDDRLRFKKALIATGARGAPSAIPGLDKVGYHNSRTIFELTALPARLLVIGGGPLGCELAQAFRRLGSHVAIIQNDPKFLPLEERDAAQILAQCMDRDGIEIRLNTTVVAARIEKGVKLIDTENYGVRETFAADAVVLGAGRLPNIEDLGLEAAGIDSNGAGIRIDDFFRTSNRRVFAAGDVCLDQKFANAADGSGRMAAANALGGPRGRRSGLTIPWCTYCDPEIAHIGMDVREARARGVPVRTFTVMMQDVDRAIIDGKDDGFVKIHLEAGTDRILGASIVASCASEMINEIAVVMAAGMGMRDLANVLHAYPAQSEAIRMAAMNFMRHEAGRAGRVAPAHGIDA